MNYRALSRLLLVGTLGLLSACHSDDANNSGTQPTNTGNPPVTSGTQPEPSVNPPGPSDDKIGFDVLLNDIFAVMSNDEPVELESLNIESSSEDTGVFVQLLAEDVPS